MSEQHLSEFLLAMLARGQQELERREAAEQAAAQKRQQDQHRKALARWLDLVQTIADQVPVDLRRYATVAPDWRMPEEFGHDQAFWRVDFRLPGLAEISASWHCVNGRWERNHFAFSESDLWQISSPEPGQWWHAPSLALALALALRSEQQRLKALRTREDLLAQAQEEERLIRVRIVEDDNVEDWSLDDRMIVAGQAADIVHEEVDQ